MKPLYIVFAANTCRGHEPDRWSDISELTTDDAFSLHPEGYTSDIAEAERYCAEYNRERVESGYADECCIYYACYASVQPLGR